MFRVFFLQVVAVTEAPAPIVSRFTVELMGLTGLHSSGSEVASSKVAGLSFPAVMWRDVVKVRQRTFRSWRLEPSMLCMTPQTKYTHPLCYPSALSKSSCVLCFLPSWAFLLQCVSCAASNARHVVPYGRNAQQRWCETAKICFIWSLFLGQLGH